MWGRFESTPTNPHGWDIHQELLDQLRPYEQFFPLAADHSLHRTAIAPILHQAVAQRPAIGLIERGVARAADVAGLPTAIRAEAGGAPGGVVGPTEGARACQSRYAISHANLAPTRIKGPAAA